MTKYYRLENANRLIAGIAFEPVEVFAGMLIGVYQADTEEDINKLDGAASDPASGVEELTSEQYLSHLQKKTPSLTRLQISKEVQPEKSAIKDVGAVVVDGQDIPQSDNPEIKTVDEALKLEPVKSQTKKRTNKKDKQ